MRTITKKVAIAIIASAIAWSGCKRDAANPKPEPEIENEVDEPSANIMVEAEFGTVSNSATIIQHAGSSGGAFVDLNTGSLSIPVAVKTSGSYDIYLRASAPSGEKTNTFNINGAKGNFVIPQTTVYKDVKLASRLAFTAGTHTMQIQSSWGWINIDYIRLVSVGERTYNLKTTLSNSASTAATKELFTYMTQQFGKRMISGQTDRVDEFAYIKNLTGKTPLMRGYDMQPYSPRYSYSWDSNCGCHAFGPNMSATNTDDAIAWYNSNSKKPIIQFQWHWHSPLGGRAGTNTFYTSDTDFDVSKAVIPGTPEYTATIRDIDAIALQLKKLQAAGVPVLWRPLHELGGTWFWWSTKGPEVFKSLWNIMYERLANHHQLNNLIWVWNGNDADWYVGNDKCDIASIDYYGDPFSYVIVKDEFEKIYEVTAGTKILGMSENGTIPNVDQSFANGVTWAFFMTWYEHLTTANKDQMIQSFYNNPKVITLENR